MARRRAWLTATVNRFEAASGVKVDNARLALVASELDRCAYSRTQARAAELWIIRGNPARFGTLTLPDFFPTREQLASVAFDAVTDLSAEYTRGYEAGRAAGIAEERRLWTENQGYLALQAEASRAVDLDMRERLLASRESALAERLHTLDAREDAIARTERNLRRLRIEPKDAA